MSNRTKSFFDQNHSDSNGPRHPHWQRQQNKVPLGETSNNAAPSKPPLRPTSQAVSKLKAFQFVPGQPDSAASTNEDGKENEQGEDVGAREHHAEATVERSTWSGGDGDKSSSYTPQLPHANTFPCTPGTRIPLEDLIGNFDEKNKASEPADVSPEEQLGWIPNSSSTLLTPNRKRKRAKSSSPSCPNTSSQRQETSAFFSGTAANAEKRTPEADPAAALWQRYDAAKRTDGELNAPDLSLIFQASPGAVETPAKSSGLRRWASTGNDWPTSKSKRRRTKGRTGISLWQNEQAVETCSKSRVADIVDKLQETLASQRLATAIPPPRVEGPSSSSPLPEVGALDAFSGVPSASPLQARQTSAATRTEDLRASTVTANVSVGPTRQPNMSHVRDEINDTHSNKRSVQPSESVISAPLHLQSKSRLPAYKRPSMSRTPSIQQQQKVQAPVPHVTAVTEDFDEFGDDLDLSAADFEELMTQPPPLHQRPLHQIPAHPDPPPLQHSDIQQHGSPPHSARNGTMVPQPVQTNGFDDEDDEFGCDDIDEASLAQAELNATQVFRASLSNSNISQRTRSPRKAPGVKKAHSPKKSSPSKPVGDVHGGARLLKRYVVKQIVEGQYTNAKGRKCPEKLLIAEDERSPRPTAITLRDSWATTAVSTDNIVHIADLRLPSDACPPSSPPGQIMISDAETSPFLIVHPDHMLSATTVADSFDCIRKAVLQDRIKATGETSKAMVYGKILHEIFQQALSANRWDDGFLMELVDRTVESHVEGLWELGMQDTVLAIEEVKAKMGELSAWARIFVADAPSEVALVDDKQGEKVWMSVSKLIAIEEHVWSPQYGLKGNIDATVQSTLIDHPGKPAKKLIVPFEVKTGRTTQSPAHRAQTALYTLLLSDRYDVNVAASILYYLESSAMSRIAPPINEIRQMVQQRNRLAAYVHRARHQPSEKEQLAAPQTQEIEDSGLPTLLKNAYKCGKCYAQQSCFTYHALAEQGSAQSAGMIDDGKKNHSLVWQEAVGQLRLTAENKSQAEELRRWFSKWDRLLTFEESDLSRLRKELWTMSSSEREAAGRCFGGLVVGRDCTATQGAMASSIVDGIEGTGGKINRFAYVFVRANDKVGRSFAEGSQLTIGEPIVVSSESGQWALANGYVVATSKHDITVAVDRRLGDARQREDNFDADSNQAFRGIMDVGRTEAQTASMYQQPMLYRLDKDGFSNGLALIRNNLVTLMSSHPIHTKLRSQIIFSAAPTFTSPSQPTALPPSQLGTMNEDQLAAVAKVLSAEDYALILGMPGTGKTTTIAHIIRALLAEEKSILLTSFTHTAVDNILLKIRDIAPPNSILRLGVPAKINPLVQEFCLLASTPRKSIHEIDEAYMGCRIVATTCMGTNHALFSRRAFDACIVDEASQITLPTSLGPLLHARKFVLVGDHYQLPPLVQNKAALEGGLDVSLFRQLSEEYPEAVASLGRQYRMCEDIMSLSNALIYGGQLRCGSSIVARRSLQLPNWPVGLLTFHTPSASCPGPDGKCWLSHLTSPERKVIFASTDLLGASARETLTPSHQITNILEATLTAQLTLAFLALGVPAKDIGIMTLYRSQLSLLRHTFRNYSIDSGVEIDSADRFQGRDKEVIILSFVRSNEAGIVGELLKDWRRVNVALTRARSKLILLGSRKTLGHNELLAKLLRLVDDRGWAVDLPKDADSLHDFDQGSQASVPAPSSKTNRSPTKGVLACSPSTARVLQASQSAGNRSPAKRSGLRVGMKQPAKTVNGKLRGKKVVDLEIWEDLVGIAGVVEDF